MQKAFITGGCGFIGSHLADLLLGKGIAVKVLDNLSFGRKEYLPKQTELVVGDIADYDLLLRESAGCDFVFHLAALASVPESVDKPILYEGVNVGGTLNVFEAAKQNNAQRVVFASSSAVYGSVEPPHIESMQPNPLSPYALNKLAGEAYARLYSRLYGLDTVSLRFFNVFGPRQALKGQYSNVVPIFSKQFIKDEPVVLVGHGKQTRDYIFVKDVARACYLAAVAKEKLCGEILNIGSGKGISGKELFGHFSAIFGLEKEAELVPSRPGDPEHTLASVERAKKLIGFEPEAPLRSALEETVSWYKKNLESLE